MYSSARYTYASIVSGEASTTFPKAMSALAKVPYL
jgi:hypothetical protein